MNGEQNQQKKLVSTTDYLEAVGVFRFCKNILFVILLLALLVQQASFWLVTADIVKPDDKNTSSLTVLAAQSSQPAKQKTPQAKTEIKLTDRTDRIEEAAEKVTAEPNQPTKSAQVKSTVEKIIKKKIAGPAEKAKTAFLNITLKHISWIIRFVNFILVIAAVLYCLTMLFTLKVSLSGQLGGINHIARAFFISLLMVVLLLPWQRYFQGIVAGVIFTPDELFRSCKLFKNQGFIYKSFFYLRFFVYWLLVFFLLIFAQIRSARWAKAILKRLEVI